MSDMDRFRLCIDEELRTLHAEETKIDAELTHYFSIIAGTSGRSGGRTKLSFESLDISSSVEKLGTFGPTFEAMQQDSKKLVAQVEDCRALSDKLSSIVRRLDTMQIRAQQTLACTEDIINLKDCKTKIIAAIEDRNLSAAVGYIRQVNEIDELAARSSDDFEIIKEKEQVVKKMVQMEFKKAIEASDIKSVMELCPLLQTLGLEAEARDSFLDFVETSVFSVVSADASSVEGATDPSTAYAKSLSNVFNSAYVIVQQYLPMVIQGMENSHGDVHFLRRLHKKVETESGLVLKRYMKFRGVREVLTAVRNSGSTRTAELHSIMDELALLIQYCCRYAKYLKHICRGAESKVRKSSRREDGVGSSSGTGTGTSIGTGAAPEEVVVFPSVSAFDKMVDELINKYYMEGEQWLMRARVAQALPLHGLDGGGAGGEGAGQLQLQLGLDECFFMLQKSGLRAVATSNIQAASAVLHQVSDALSVDLLAQANALLAATVVRLEGVMQEHVAQFRRGLHPQEDEGGGIPLLKNFFSSEGSGAGAGGGIRLEEEGGFSLTGEGRKGTPGDPWGVAGLNEAFNLVELCVRYTERLNHDIAAAAGSVFAEEGEKEGRKSSMELDTIKLCRDDFEVAKISFSNALRQGAERLVAAAHHQIRDVISATIGRGGPLGGVRFDETDALFEAQPSLSLLPRVLCLPLETLVNVCTFGLSDRNKDMVVGLLAEACCERLEAFITMTSFRFAGALKLEEIVRALSSVFGRHSSLPVRAHFSRLREVMLVLTADASTISTGAGGQVGGAGAFTENFSQLTASEVEVFLSLRLDVGTH